MGNLMCCVKVDQSTVAVKERFGKFEDVLEPGCHCMPWFLGCQVAGHLSLRLQQLDVKCETKTKDNVFVNVVASIQYRALSENASDAFYKLTNTRSQIQAYVFDVIRATLPKLNLDDAFEQKNDIAKAVEDELEKAMSAYGFQIVQTLIVNIEPDEHVKRSMNEINAAARLRLAATEKAEADKIVQIKRAEGDAEAKHLAGLGIARQRQAIVDGLQDSVLSFSVNVPGTTAKDVLDMVLITSTQRRRLVDPANPLQFSSPTDPGLLPMSRARFGMVCSRRTHCHIYKCATQQSLNKRSLVSIIRDQVCTPKFIWFLIVYTGECLHVLFLLREASISLTLSLTIGGKT